MEKRKKKKNKTTAVIMCMLCLNKRKYFTLKCYSQILCGGSAKHFRFQLFCIDLMAQKQEILKHELKGPESLFRQNRQYC